MLARCSGLGRAAGVVVVVVVAAVAGWSRAPAARAAQTPSLVAAAASLPTSFPRSLAGSCVRIDDRRPRRPREISASLPPSVLSGFGVLRRPRRTADALPASSRDSLSVEGLRVIFGRYVRRAGEIATGARYYVVLGSVRTRLSRGCMARLSARRRKLQRPIAARTARTVVLCLDDFENGGGDYCFAAEDALAGKAFASADGPEPPGTTDPSQIPVAVSALVPDGAASLEARYPREAPISAAVADNFVTFLHTIHLKPHARGFPNFNPATAIFRRADGTVLMTVRPPVDAPAFGE